MSKRWAGKHWELSIDFWNNLDLSSQSNQCKQSLQHFAPRWILRCRVVSLVSWVAYLIFLAAKRRLLAPSSFTGRSGQTSRACAFRVSKSTSRRFPPPPLCSPIRMFRSSSSRRSRMISTNGRKSRHGMKSTHTHTHTHTHTRMHARTHAHTHARTHARRERERVVGVVVVEKIYLYLDAASEFEICHLRAFSLLCFLGAV